MASELSRGYPHGAPTLSPTLTVDLWLMADTTQSRKPSRAQARGLVSLGHSGQPCLEQALPPTTNRDRARSQPQGSGRDLGTAWGGGELLRLRGPRYHRGHLPKLLLAHFPRGTQSPGDPVLELQPAGFPWTLCSLMEATQEAARIAARFPSTQAEPEGPAPQAALSRSWVGT